ncbi:hypothetical protein Droror1_Dr00001107 [Drosera rotundifolia]
MPDDDAQREISIAINHTMIHTGHGDSTVANTEESHARLKLQPRRKRVHLTRCSGVLLLIWRRNCMVELKIAHGSDGLTLRKDVPDYKETAESARGYLHKELNKAPQQSGQELEAQHQII